MTDFELSFEDLTFGGDEPVSGTKKNIQNPKSDSKNDNQVERVSSSSSVSSLQQQQQAAQGQATNENNGPEPNVLLISTLYGGKLNFPTILKMAERFGSIKNSSHKDNQHFCFVQFETSEAHEQAISKWQPFELDGYKFTIERCSRISPGRDPRTHDASSEFKSATLVFKNLPFAMKQEKVEEILNTYPHKPQSVNYLYDGSGMFRGMAFVKFKDIETARAAFEVMNGMDINGRKVRIEYKRKIQEIDLPDDDLKISDVLNDFKTNHILTELAFPCGSSYQRKMVHQIAEKLGLTHYSTDSETRNVIVKKKDPNELQLSTTPPQHILMGSSPSRIAQQLQNSSQPNSHSGGQSRSRRNTNERGITPSSSYEGRNNQQQQHAQSPQITINVQTQRGFHPPSRHAPSPSNIQISSSPSSNSSSFGTSPNYKNSAALLNRVVVENGNSLHPLRQPIGPDGKTNGFSKQYQQSRSSTA